MHFKPSTNPIVSVNRRPAGAFLTLVIYLFSLCAAVFPRQIVQAAAPIPQPPINRNNLSIEPVSAYNAIVDSNVLSPSSYGPSAATLGARFCNTGSSDLVNVWAYTGSYYTTDLNNPVKLPGVFPQRDPGNNLNGFQTQHPHLANMTQSDFGGASVFRLEHEAGTSNDRADASRYIGTLKSGECRVHYWLVSYPRKARLNAGSGWVSVTGGIKPEDDLWLEYDFWATTTDSSGAVLPASYVRRSLTMRNEISAMANKIWPNGDNKVPDEYRTAIASVVGWETITPSGTATVYPGQTITSQGIWYDFGNVGAGFDNNLDFVPDRNAWAQPVGDHTIYDPGCFRLVRTYGLVVVKLNDGSEKLIPFVDQLYFENIPANNTGAVGLVYYEYISLDGACTASLTPYQEVASGYDNEKFNGDFGAGVPPLQSQKSNIIFDKNGEAAVQAGGIGLAGEIDYTMRFTLPADGASPSLVIGNSAVGLPFVFRETIPMGTTYKAGSAAFDTTTAPPISINLAGTILYSHDNGVSWSVNQAPANTVTHIEWWLNDSVRSLDASDTTGGVKFTVSVPASYTNPVVADTGCLKFGLADCFLEDTHTTLVTGSYQLSGTVFADNGGTNGIRGDGIINGNEAGIGDTPADADTTGVTIWLFWDGNGDKDGDDAGDFLLATTTTNASGNYAFTVLPAGNYVTKVDVSDNQSALPAGDIPAGYGLTTSLTRPAALSSTNPTLTGLNFGFSPALSVTKRLETTTPSFVGDIVNFTLRVGNTLPGSGEATNSCKYKVYASIAHTDDTLFPAGSKPTNGQWISTAQALGPSDGLFAYTNMNDNTDLLGLSGFNIGNLGGTISKVELALNIYEKANFKPTDNLYARVFYNNIPTAISTSTFNGETYFTGAVGAQYNPLIELTTLRAWTWSDFSNNLTEIQLEGNKGGGSGDSGDIALDSAAFIITTSGACGGSGNVLNPVELKDFFDPNYLSYVSASLPPTSVAGGTLTWNNVGALNPGQYRDITVSFRTLLAGSTTNKDESLSSYFAAGVKANDDPQTQLDNQATLSIAAAPITGTISGLIWDDDSNNGWPAASSTGYGTDDTLIPDARVMLYACKGTSTGSLIIDTGPLGSCTNDHGAWVLIATSYTGQNGAYAFNALRAGFYRVVVDETSIVGSTGQTGDVNEKTGLCTICDDQSNTANDDMDATNFLIQMGNPGYSFSNINFGYRAPDVSASTIGNLLFFDWNGNGIQDPGNEEGILGVTVNLYDLSGDLVRTVVTDANGAYNFGDLPAGFYTVRVDPASLPAGLVQTLDPDTNGVCVTCDNIGTTSVNGTAAGSDDTLDFAYKPTGTGAIGDTVFKDLNSNGVQDGTGEAGIAGVTVQVWVDLNRDSSDVILATKVTDANGLYLFENLPVGAFYNYRVVIVLDAANKTAIPNDAFGSDYYNSSGTLESLPNPNFIYLRASITTAVPRYLSADFGFAPPASFGDTVYYDLDGDGQQDWNEPGIPGVTVSLHTFADNDSNRRYNPAEFDTLSAALVTKTTGAQGKYIFSGLSPFTASTSGLYAVKVTPPVGVSLTGDPNMDGVVCPAGGQPLCDNIEGMRLYPGTNYTGADFGYRPNSGFFGDYIWLDSNSDGVQDSAETGLAGVTVTATTVKSVYVNGNLFAGGTTLTTTTDFDGRYNFGLITSAGGAGSSAAWTVTVSGGLPAGLSQTFDPDGNNAADRDGSTTLSIDSYGVVTTPAGSACTDCAYNADFGYSYPSGATSMSGTLCMDFTGGAPNTADDQIGICGKILTPYVGVDTNESPFSGVAVYLYRWDDSKGSTSGKVEANELTLYQTSTSSSSGDYSFTHLWGDDSAKYVVVLNSPQENLELTTMSGDPLAISPGASSSIVVESNPTPGLSPDTQVYQIITTPHNVAIQNIDFAFQSTTAYDFGDLPVRYSTTLSSAPDGARHTLLAGLYLGSTPPDAEENGQPSDDGKLDNFSTVTNTSVEEDGVNLTDDYWSDKTGSMEIRVNGSGYLAGWIDFNKNGSFADPGELIVNQAVSTSTLTTDFPTPAITAGSFAARFRLFASAPLFPNLAFSGVAAGGEVEDYYFTVTPTAVTIFDFMARPTEGGVRLLWTTTSEIDHLGFHLYRQPAEGGDFAQITPDMILSLAPGQLTGADYEWLDTSADLEANYVYRLEAIDIYGGIQLFTSSYQRDVQPVSDPPYRMMLPFINR